MKKLTRIIAGIFSVGCLLSFGMNVFAEDSQELVNETFDANTLPAGFYYKDTFDNAETLSEYSWNNDGSTTAVIDDGLLKYKRKLVQKSGYIDRKLDIQKGTADIIVFEYDLYPIDKRHDKTTTYEFEFPAVLDDAGKKYCDFYIQPASANSTVCKLIKRSGGVLDTEFKLGTDYMYHVTLVLDMAGGKYNAIFEENNLNDESVRTIVCPWTSIYSTAVNGNISAFRFAGGHEWGSAQLNLDNFECYSPKAVEFDAENSNVSDDVKIEARSAVELSFTNPLADGWKDAINILDSEGNIVECNKTLKNSGRCVSLEAADGRFEYLSEYTVAVDSEKLTDIFAQNLAESIEITFLTGDVPEALINFSNSPSYKLLNEAGEEVSSISDAVSVTAELIGVKNDSADEDSKRGVALIIGVYDEAGSMLKYSKEEKILEKGDNSDLKAELNLEEYNKAENTIRMYIWDGLPGAPYALGK